MNIDDPVAWMNATEPKTIDLLLAFKTVRREIERKAFESAK